MALPAKKVSLGVVVVILLLLFSAASFSVHAHARRIRLIYVDGSGTIQSSTLDLDKKHKPHWGGYIDVRGDGKYQAYSVLLREHPNGGEAAMDDKDARRRWYESFLPSTLTDSGEPRLRNCFPIRDNGFLAMLTRAEAKVLFNKPEVRSMFSHHLDGSYIYSPGSCGFLRQQPERIRGGASFTRSRPAF